MYFYLMYLPPIESTNQTECRMLEFKTKKACHARKPSLSQIFDTVVK